jgi:hypothetical protein
MIVSSQLFEAYIECATKCWLRSRAEPATGNVYAEWARAQNEVYRKDALKKLLAVFPEAILLTACRRDSSSFVSNRTSTSDAPSRVLGTLRNGRPYRAVALIS